MITSCSQTTGQCFPWTMNNRKLTDIKHFFLPFMLFEACGAVFIMNSKINLRKLAWGSISVISHHFPVYSLSGSTANRCMRPSFSSLLSLKFFSLFFWCKIFHSEDFQPLFDSGTLLVCSSVLFGGNTSRFANSKHNFTKDE